MVAGDVWFSLEKLMENRWNSRGSPGQNKVAMETGQRRVDPVLGSFSSICQPFLSPSLIGPPFSRKCRGFPK